LNYTNKDRKSLSPLKKGKLEDVVKLKKPRVSRSSYKSDKEVIDALGIDLVQIFAEMGIVIKNIHTIAKGLCKLGWIKQKRIE